MVKRGALILLLLGIMLLGMAAGATAIRYSLEPNCADGYCVPGEPIIWDVYLYKVNEENERLQEYSIMDARFRKPYHKDTNETWFHTGISSIYRRLYLSAPTPNINDTFVYYFCYRVGTLFDDKRSYTNEYCFEVNHTLNLIECKENKHCSNNQTCAGHTCQDITCGWCQYFNGTACTDYPCCTDGQCRLFQACTNNTCEDKICQPGEYLVNHTCSTDKCGADEAIINFTCTPLACGFDEGYVDHSCAPLDCGVTQGYFNHTCVNLLCLPHQTWGNHTCLNLSCRDVEIPENHRCVPLKCTFPFITEEHECRLNTILIIELLLCIIIIFIFLKNLAFYERIQRKKMFSSLWKPFEGMRHTRETPKTPQPSQKQEAAKPEAAKPETPKT